MLDVGLNPVSPAVSNQNPTSNIQHRFETLPNPPGSFSLIPPNFAKRPTFENCVRMRRELVLSCYLRRPIMHTDTLSMHNEFSMLSLPDLLLAREKNHVELMRRMHV